MAYRPLSKIVKKIIIFFVTSFFMILGFSAGFIISQILQSEEYSFQSILIIIDLIIISLAIAVYIHNLGHYLFGKAMGYEIIKWQPSEILMIPFRQHVKIKKQCLYISGGILLNLLTGVLLTLLLINMPLELPNIYRLLIMFTSFALILHSFVNLVPHHVNEKPTDGKLIWSILFNDPYARNYLYPLNYSEGILAGHRPAEIPLATFNRTFNNNKLVAPSGIILILNLYYKALDSRNIKDILVYSQLLSYNIFNTPPEIYNPVNYELCFINCIKGDSDNALEYYNNVKDVLENSYDMSSLRIRAYFELYVNQNKEAAVFYAKAALSIKDDYKLKGMVPIETELLEEIIVSV